MLRPRLRAGACPLPTSKHNVPRGISSIPRLCLESQRHVFALRAHSKDESKDLKVGSHNEVEVGEADSHGSSSSSSTSSSRSTSSNSSMEAGTPMETGSDDNPNTSSSFKRNDDVLLQKQWEDIKKEIKSVLGPEESKVVDSVSLDEVINGRGLDKMMDQVLSPLLQQLGLENEDPVEFFYSLVGLTLFMQFTSVGMLFYGAELWGHLNAGDAFRVASGLALGYFLRPIFKMEQLLWPFYDWGLKAAGLDAEYRVVTNKEDTTKTINGLGILVALAFFVPQGLLGWDVNECLQFVKPLPAGLIMFDICFMVALLVKTNRS